MKNDDYVAVTFWVLAALMCVNIVIVVLQLIGHP
jgi:hypothetical protein